jgi:hypothetical protein
MSSYLIPKRGCPFEKFFLLQKSSLFHRSQIRKRMNVLKYGIEVSLPPVLAALFLFPGWLGLYILAIHEDIRPEKLKFFIF